MAPLIRILHIEADSDDAQIFKNLIKKAGLACQIIPIKTYSEFEKALQQDKWDLFLADFRLVECDGLSALRLSRRNRPDVPFLFVSDTRSVAAPIEGWRVRFNKAGEHLTGYHRRDVLGKTDYDLFSRQETDFFTARDREALGAGKLVDIAEETIRNKSNEVRILHTKKIPIMDEGGVPQYLLGISEDITERKETDENLIFLFPRIKVLFMSGYTGNIIAHHGVLEEGIHFLQKPITIQSLATKLRETLDEEK